MVISQRTFRFCALFLCVAYSSAAQHNGPTRPANQPYWPWTASAPQSANLMQPTPNFKQREQEPCVCPMSIECDNIEEKCRPLQYEGEPTNNEVDYEATTPLQIPTTPPARSRSSTPQPGEYLSVTDLGGPDDDFKDESDDSEAHCGIDSREYIFDTERGSDSTSTYFAEYPWVLYLYLKEKDTITTLCHATLLQAKIAITAAHCVKDYGKKNVTARAGEWDIESEYGRDERIHHQDIAVKKIIIHDNFTENRMLNDIAILHLEKPFLHNKNVRYACLPTIEDKYRPICSIAGWGSTGDTIDPLKQRFQRQSQLSLINRTNCEKEFQRSGKGPRFHLRKTQICARNIHVGNTCVGGCGGGMFCQTVEAPNRFVLVGISSWGKCTNKEIGVFSNVYVFMKWIQDTIEDINDADMS